MLSLHDALPICGLCMTAESPIRTHVRRLIGLNLRLGNEAELILLAAEHFGRKLPFGIFGEFAADDIAQTRDKTRHFLETDLEPWMRSEEHTPELQTLMRISYAAFCLKKKYRRIQ